MELQILCKQVFQQKMEYEEKRKYEGTLTNIV